MKGTWENNHFLDRNKKANGNIKQMGVAKRLKVASLNSHLICALCSGYFVEATTIVECLHTFCRSCIVKYLQTSNFCPVCDVQIHGSKPWFSLREDKTLQDLVYKLVPGLYQDEMRRRRMFYTHLGTVDVMNGEEGGFLPNGARFFSLDDSISLSLEYYSGQDEDEGQNPPNKKKHINDQPKRYLQCPAAVTVRHLKKFLRMKYGIGLDCWVDIIYNDECLPEIFSLIDVAYTFGWKRTSPMRFAYRIFSKVIIRTVKLQKNAQISRVDEGEGDNSKNKPTLEQSEYLGNFNLNPTNSDICKSPNCSKSINSRTSTNHNHNTLKSGFFMNEKKEESCPEQEDGSLDKLIQSSEDSNTSGLRIISEKEDSIKGNSEDSQESVLCLSDERIKSEPDISSYADDAVDSFAAKKLLKKKLEEKTYLEVSYSEKRRKSTGHTEDHKEKKKKFSLSKRRKTIPDEFTSRREEEKHNAELITIQNDDEEEQNVGSVSGQNGEGEGLGNLKNEALKKVFVIKEKTEDNNKKSEGEVRKKKRKKSKHHDSESKKRRLEEPPTSPSILSFAKDALKLKVKLTPNKTAVKLPTESEVITNNKEIETDSDKSSGNLNDSDNPKNSTDKERLLHLRAVRHKNVVNKGSPKDYINAPPSLTISKVDSSEPQSMKSTLVESKPSLEIMLVTPTNNSKVKIDLNSDSRKEPESKKVETPRKETQRSEVVDNFGVLDLSEKSTRTKENSSNSSSSKETPETVERCRKTTHQSIMQIAQNLVNRKLSPMLNKNNLKSGYEVPPDTSATSAAMRNLKTLSDTAVNILMAAQGKNFSCDPQKRPFPVPISAPSPSSISPTLSTKSSKDSENGSGLKIPIYPIMRDRIHPIPAVPNLHEIFPRSQGRHVPVSRPSTPIFKPGQNQTVRQIPNPFVVLNRQGTQNPNTAKQSPTLSKSEKNEELNLKHKLNSIPPLQSIKTKTLIPKLEDLVDINNQKNSSDLKALLMAKTPTTTNNNNNNNNNNNKMKVQNGSEYNFFGLKNGDEKKETVKLNNSTNPVRKIENMAKNIESVAAGLTARAVSNAMIDAK